MHQLTLLDIIKSFSHEDMYTVLEETLRLLKGRVDYGKPSC